MSELPAHPPEENSRLIDHLLEMRTRLLRSLIVFGIVAAAMLPFANKIYGYLAQPLLDRLPEGGKLIAIDVASPFFVPLKLVLVVAVLICVPWFLYQAWAFVAPGLYQREKRMAKPILVSAVALFYLGCAFAYFLVLPTVFGFMAKTTPQGVSMMTDINRYLDFTLVIFLAFGLCFEVPVALVILVVLGLVTPAQLREWRGYAIVGIFAVAAVLTPPDVLSQLLLAFPMMALYELGILAGSWLKPKNSQVTDTLG